MTAMKNIGTLGSEAINTPLANSKLWERDVETISPEEIYAFIQRHKMIGNEGAARHSVDVLLSELKKSIAKREITGCKIDRLSAFDVRLSLSDISKLLHQMSRVKVLATLFALETDVDLKDITLLRWSQLNKMQLSERAKEVVTYLVRHIRTDLVFWEYDSGRISPLFSFEAYVESVTGYEWGGLQAAYDSRIDINFEASFDSLKLFFKGSMV